VTLVMGPASSRAQAPAPSPSPAREKLLVVTNSFDDAVSIFRLQGAVTPSSVKTLPTGARPTEVCVSPDGRRAYVSNSGDATVTVLDLDALRPLTTLSPTGMKIPDGCAVSPDSTKLYVADPRADLVFVISTETHKVLKELKTGPGPRRVLIAADGTVHVSSEKAGVSLVRDDQLVATRKVGRGPRGIALTPDGQTLVVASVDDDALSFLDVASGEVRNTIGAVGNSPQRVAVTQSGELAVVVSRNTHSLHIVDLKDGQRRARLPVHVGRMPFGVELSDSPNHVFVLVSGENLVAVVDLRNGETIRVIPTGKYPLGMALRR
jgi:YVTN family beta-propeller protein